MKFAFVTPRYGADLPAGPEHACRLLAEQISQRHGVEVLTTCSSDATTWRNDYSEGVDRVRGVVVRRFVVNQSRDHEVFQQLSSRVSSAIHSRDDELEWSRQLGPSSPGLVDHLKRHQRSYDAVVFFSLLHTTTIQGMAASGERTILFPYLRLDKTLRFSLCEETLGSARAVGYFSTAEQRLAHLFFRDAPRVDEVIGIGTDSPANLSYPKHQQNPADSLSEGRDDDSRDDLDGVMDGREYLSGPGVPFRRRHRLSAPFALYGGRMLPDNGCEEMIEYFHHFHTFNSDTSLVLMGVKLLNVPAEPYVRLAGILPARDRMAAYEAADVTLAPDPDDLLAQSVLDSFAVGTPVLASARNAAAVDLCRRSGAGLYYSNREEFVEAMTMLMSEPTLRERMGRCGREYVRLNHRWDIVTSRFDRLVTKVRAR